MCEIFCKYIKKLKNKNVCLQPEINISIMVFVRKILICLAAFSVALTSCRNESKKTEVSKCDELLLTAFIEAHTFGDSLAMNPRAVMDIFYARAHETTDSISFYSLLQAISVCYSWSGEMDSSMRVLEKVMKYCERVEQTPCILLLQAETFFRYGVRLSQFRNHDEAGIYYKKAYEAILKSKIRDSRLIKMAFILATYYNNKSDFPNASYYYRKSLFLTDSLIARSGIRYNEPTAKLVKFNIQFALAGMYSDIGNFDMAEYYFEQAETYLDNVGDLDRVYFYDYIGEFYLKMNDYSRAMNNFRFVYNYVLSYSYPNHEERAFAAAKIGNMHLRMGQIDSALHYSNIAKNYYDQSDRDRTLEFYVDGLQAMLALQENKLGEAEKLLSKPYDIALIEPSFINEHNQQLEELYARKNDYKNAYIYRLKVDEYNDSVRNINVRNNIAEMDMRFRQDTTLLRKDLRIAVAEGRASRWKSIAATSLLSLTLLAALASGFVFRARRKREKEYSKQMATVTELRMQIVRNRLSPHFVFNALNIMMPTMGQHKELEQHFNVLIHLLRNNLRASEQMASSLNAEIHLVKNYLQLQELSNPERMKVEWQIADDVPQDARIPSMSIQIPVENAVKYAFTSGQEDAQIDICISLQTNELNIVIEDNGIGYRAGADAFDERGTGSGLKMLHRTVDLLNLHNSAKMVFKIENRQQAAAIHGTRVTLIVPTDYRFD